MLRLTTTFLLLTAAASAQYALIGGGKDLDEAFRWIIKKSDGGKFVVIRASGTDAYNPYVRELGGMKSVETIITTSAEAARDAASVEKIRNASALFIAGGDQWKYVDFWRGGPFGAAIQHLIDKGVPVGGTSAGLAILGEYSYTAEKNTVTSKQALENPFDERVTVGKDFLRVPHLQRVITDTHFAARDRMGRTLAFLARMLEQDPKKPARAIAVDERTAGLLEKDGSMQVVGNGSIYCIQARRPAAVCKPGQPLTFGDIAVYRVPAGQSFDVKNWKGTGGKAYTLSIDKGVVRSTQDGGGIY